MPDEQLIRGVLVWKRQLRSNTEQSRYQLNSMDSRNDLSATWQLLRASLETANSVQLENIVQVVFNCMCDSVGIYQWVMTAERFNAVMMGGWMMHESGHSQSDRSDAGRLKAIGVNHLLVTWPVCYGFRMRSIVFNDDCPLLYPCSGRILTAVPS